MKQYILLLVLMVMGAGIHAYAEDVNPVKEGNVISGHVVEKGTENSLPYATILIVETGQGTVSNEDGEFRFKKVPAGKYTLRVQLLGYETQEKKVTVSNDFTVDVHFLMSDESIMTDEVVVSANRNETSRKVAPVVVNVMNAKLFESVNSTDLAKSLNYQSGLRVENNCQNCGYQQVRINGLDGPYTQILIDSRPIFSALAGVYGLEQIPANMIERVEVMRGGGSALFGSSAIAGTINIITKEPVRNSAQFSHTLTGIGDASVFENNTTMNASLVSDNQKLGLAVFGQNRERAGYDHDGDGFTELPELKSQTVGMRSYIKTSDYSKVTVEYHHLQEHCRGGDQLALPPHEALIAEQLKHSINTGGVKFDLFSPDEKQRLGIYASAQHIDRDSYYGGGEDL